MKKLILIAVLALGSFSIQSCRESTGEKAEDTINSAAEDTENNLEEIGDEIEETGNDIERKGEQLGDEIDEEINNADDN